MRKMTLDEMPAHGGNLCMASKKYQIALSDWLDLSTGLNPDGYPIPPVPESFFRRLPQMEENDLINAAKRYYNCQHLVAGAGSQQLIQLLPTLQSPCRVAIPAVGYQEHAYHWKKNKHSLVYYDTWNETDLERLIEADEVDCVVIINPSNPTGVSIGVKKLLQWQRKVTAKAGYLIIDEAFADASSNNSFSRYSELPGVIILRSLGKFFGLAGVRVGFALCEQVLAKQIQMELGPWAVAGPAQYIAAKALNDKQWQSHAVTSLEDNCQWMLTTLRELFSHHDVKYTSTPLFVSMVINTEIAQCVHEAMAQKGILIRYWDIPDNGRHALLRFGLISQSNGEWRKRFQSSLSDVVSSLQ